MLCFFGKQKKKNCKSCCQGPNLLRMVSTKPDNTLALSLHHYAVNNLLRLWEGIQMSGFQPHLQKSKKPQCQAYCMLLSDKAELSTDSDMGGTDSEQEIESDSEIERDGPQECSPPVVPVFGPAILNACRCGW